MRFVVFGLVLSVACGGRAVPAPTPAAAPSARATARPQAELGYAREDRSLDEVARLWREIRQWNDLSLGFDLPEDLAEHVCENAAELCRIVDADLPSHDWARGKCADANRACARGQGRTDTDSRYWLPCDTWRSH